MWVWTGVTGGRGTARKSLLCIAVSLCMSCHAREEAAYANLRKILPTFRTAWKLNSGITVILTTAGVCNFRHKCAKLTLEHRYISYISIGISVVSNSLPFLSFPLTQLFRIRILSNSNYAEQCAKKQLNRIYFSAHEMHANYQISPREEGGALRHSAC